MKVNTIPKGKGQSCNRYLYTIDIVIALLNTVCFVNISIPKAKAKGKHICEEFKFVHESIMTLQDL
jgi:high-affinity K+ transport system ATPase subunit B